MRNDRLRRRLAVGALTTAIAAATFSSGVLRTIDEAEWGMPQTAATAGSSSATTSGPATVDGDEAEWG